MTSTLNLWTCIHTTTTYNISTLNLWTCIHITDDSSRVLCLPILDTQAVEEKLKFLGVAYLVVPSIKSVLPMWKSKFGYRELKDDECHMIEKDIVAVDLETSTLVCKKLTNGLLLSCCQRRSGVLLFSLLPLLSYDWKGYCCCGLGDLDPCL